MYENGNTFNQTFLDAFQIEDTARLLMKRGGVLS